MLHLSLFVFLMMAALPLHASPAYTRQTGAACSMCHFQDMHSLNAYGRAFLLNGNRESEQMIEERREYEDKRAGRVPSFADKGPVEDGKAYSDDAGVLPEDWELEKAEKPEGEGLQGQTKRSEDLR